MFSATDVANFLACHHLSTLDRAQAAGEIKRPFFQDPGIEVLRELGAKHEQAYLRHLADTQSLEIAEISTPGSRATHTRSRLRPRAWTRTHPLYKQGIFCSWRYASPR